MASISSLKRIAAPAADGITMTDVAGTIDCSLLTTGPRVARFEEAFAAFTGASHAIAVNSCAAGLHLSLMASGVGSGNEVITTPLTFCATANAIVHTGATPVFADIDADTWNLDPLKAAARVSSRTRALLVVHYAGRPAPMTAFRTLASHYGLTLIDDAAQCMEGASAGRKIGTVGDFTCFSVAPFGDVPAGEGGLVATSNTEAASFIRTASLHGVLRDSWPTMSGVSPLHDVIMPGFKYGMSDLHAAVGLQHLARIDALMVRRRSIWDQYDAGLGPGASR
jgi:dTDP-4-amino-4,6-dideoxygalactose transaminase